MRARKGSPIHPRCGSPLGVGSDWRTDRAGGGGSWNQVEHDPAPAVEVEKVEEENPASPFPMPEPVEETPEPTDAVSLALRACNGGEDSREKVAGLLAVFEHITAWGKPKFCELCARYGETNESRTPDGLAAFLRMGVPAVVWAEAEQKAERAARGVTDGKL